MPKLTICKDCRFYSALKSTSHITSVRGQCRKNAPRMGYYGEADWAFVSPNDWCGDWELQHKEKSNG